MKSTRARADRAKASAVKRGFDTKRLTTDAVLLAAALIIALKTVSESDFPDSDKGKKLAEFCRKHRIIR